MPEHLFDMLKILDFDPGIFNQRFTGGEQNDRGLMRSEVVAEQIKLDGLILQKANSCIPVVTVTDWVLSSYCSPSSGSEFQSHFFALVCFIER